MLASVHPSLIPPITVYPISTSGYDDGGFSGATMARPALQRLLADSLSRIPDIFLLIVHSFDSVHDPALALVVVYGVVLDTAVVPERDRIRPIAAMAGIRQGVDDFDLIQAGRSLNTMTRPARNSASSTS